MRDRGDRAFVDSLGRERYFKGVNAITKGPPWVPSTTGFDANTSLADEDFAFLSSVGVNSVRLGTMWPGVEPSRGAYNASYVAELQRIVANGAQHGVYTLLDMHQDCLSEMFCGEGLPVWAARAAVNASAWPFPSPMGAPFNGSDYDAKTGLPTRQACARHAWSSYQASDAAGSAYQALYQNKDGLRDAWASMWAYVAAAFKGQSAVLGLELINEPWAGDAERDIWLMIPGVTDKQLLQPAYDALNGVIRAADPDVLLFFEGTTWDDLGVGFEHAPGGPEFANRSVLAIHYYEPPQFGNSSEFDFAVHVGDAKRLGVGTALTEFDRPSDSSGFEGIAASAEKALLGAAQWWEFKTMCKETAATRGGHSIHADYGACITGFGGGMFDATGAPVDKQWKRVARTYAPAVAGNLSTVAFDEATGVYTMTYAADTTLGEQAPTEIFVSEKYYYGSGVAVTVSPANAATAKHVAGSNLVTVTAAAGATFGQDVTVTVSPK